MKASNQFDVYASFYDLLYKDKDYKGESEYINKLISKFLRKRKQNSSLLDLACGTGSHLRELYKKGYSKLSGSDIAKSMISIARKKAIGKGLDIDFFNYSFQDSNKIPGSFDVILSMFSAVNYLTSYRDQSKMLSNVHGLLNNNGLFIFDYWNGYAVTHNYSPVKVLRKKSGDAEIMRISETTLDLMAQKAQVKFTCNYVQKNKKIIEFEEVHHLHYYYFSEIKNLLASHNFEVLHISPFMKMNKELSPSDWNISVVAKKIS